MSTEDDTFNRLKRMPFNEMARIIEKLNLNHMHYLTKRVLNDNGWEENDYYIKLILTMGKRK